MQTAVTHRGRQPSPDTEEAILEATREILATAGVQGLTIEGVAARSGVAKTTIYRRWRSKHDLALAVLFVMVEQQDELAPTEDLLELLCRPPVLCSRAQLPRPRLQGQ